MLAGEPSYIASSPKVTRGFCGACGSSLTYAHADRPGVIDVTLATLDDPSLIRPEAHIWVANKAPWVKLNDGLPQFAEWRSG